MNSDISAPEAHDAQPETRAAGGANGRAEPVDLSGGVPPLTMEAIALAAGAVPLTPDHVAKLEVERALSEETRRAIGHTTYEDNLVTHALGLRMLPCPGILIPAAPAGRARAGRGTHLRRSPGSADQPQAQIRVAGRRADAPRQPALVPRRAERPHHHALRLGGVAEDGLPRQLRAVRGGADRDVVLRAQGRAGDAHLRRLGSYRAERAAGAPLLRQRRADQPGHGPTPAGAHPVSHVARRGRGVGDPPRRRTAARSASTTGSPPATTLRSWRRWFKRQRTRS